jgi:Skp family chaperone for outer membrane proteins
MRLIAFLLLALFLLNGNAAWAAETGKGQRAPQLPVSIVAVIDVQHILQESAAAKDVQRQLEAQRVKFQSEISAEESKLRQAEQALTKSRETVTADVYSEHEQELRERFLTVERHVQTKRKALDQAFGDSMNVVRKSLLEIVDRTAHEHGANVVVIKQETLWNDASLEITEEVLERLNKTIAHVEVKVVTDEAEEPKK